MALPVTSYCYGLYRSRRYFIKQFSLDTDNRGNVKANEEDHKTSTKGIFVAGDMRRGQSLVVWAIHEGREAAKACDAYLNR